MIVKKKKIAKHTRGPQAVHGGRGGERKSVVGSSLRKPWEAFVCLSLEIPALILPEWRRAGGGVEEADRDLGAPQT